MPASKPPAPPALDPTQVRGRTGNSYPEPFGRASAPREKRVLGDAVGLKNFGVNLVRLPTGAASSQRHWHTHEDEFVYILEGEVALVTDSGVQTLTAGACAGFPAGARDSTTRPLTTSSTRSMGTCVVIDALAARRAPWLPDFRVRWG
jgi:uncharacterized cupin superfamily protein